ncbi:fumarylacetoacetate hydrolase family protein [Pseudalkalibacillus caeni]|uniref:4-hydroxyphenylacetate isomerase n=1 Tax=Exobacillus caeni TaxID=2574798 RepID=A0A5R9F316_9BACL|nr:fumarylacetoacetate hydrolase family protein [Pseudalkalibacillus caeni]TLS36889.1 4-hydroxyphenylacetate isomerase [Pseudalkalibacillus caeni]
MGKAIAKFHGTLQTEEVEVNLADNMILLNQKRVPAKTLYWEPPVSGTIYGTLLNFKGAIEKMGGALTEPPYKAAPKAPVLYIKPANTVSGHESPIPIPAGETFLEMGASLGVVIGRRATRVTESEALDYVMGYTVVNDVSIPHESVFRPAVKYKARDGFCPIGPWVILGDEVENPDALSIRVYINNELKQDNTTANLVRSVSKLIADVSEFMTLDEGDILLVGVPENAPLAKNGDRVRIEISNVGMLENVIVHEEELMSGGDGQ